MGTPLFDKNANQVVDMDPAQVPAALKSGQFTFVKGRNVPIIQDGTPIWVKPEDAAKKRSQLLYTSDEEVERSQAEQKTAGLGGAAKALAYGGFKSATLGLGPLVAGAVSPEAKETFRELELGRPGLTTLGELGGLAFDPFAAAAKLGQRGAAKGAAAAAEEAAAPRLLLGRAGTATEAEAVPMAAAAPSFPSAEADVAAGRAIRAERRAQRATAREAPPVYEAERGVAAEPAPPMGEATIVEPAYPEPPVLRLGGRFESAEPDYLAGKAMTRGRRLLGVGERGPIVALESPVTTAPVRQQLETWMRQPGWIGLEEAEALAAQGQRLQEGMRVAAQPEVTFGSTELLRGAEPQFGAARSLREAQMAESMAAAREAEREAIRREGLPSEFVGPEGGAAIVPVRRAGPSLADIQAAQDAAAREAMAARDMGATTELRQAFEEAPGVAPGRAMVPAGERGAVAAGERGLAPYTEAAQGAPEGGIAGLLGPAGEAAQAIPGAAGGAAQAAAPAAKAGFKLGKAGKAALEQGIYGAASQAQRQQLGLEEGGLKEIAEAGLLGAGIGAGLTLGGQKLAKGAKALTEVASQSAGPDLGSKLGQAAARAEESYLLRMFGLDKKTIKELNVRMVDAGAGKRGTSEFADFARNGIANLEALKAEFPENQFLQSIDFSRGPLRFGKLNPEQRTAFAEALMNSTGKSIEDVYSQAAGQTVNSANLADAIMRVRSSLQSKGLGDLPMETIRGELKAFEDSLRRGEQYTVGSLREYEKNLSARFREARGKEPFTEAQKLFRDEVKKAYLDAAKEVIPDIEARLAVPNREYSIAERMFKGAQDVEARLAGTSPVGRDSLAQFALGVVAVLNPVGAVSFLVATTALRGIYNQRGEGILADLAGKLAGKGISVVKAPQQAAQEAVSSVINARRPLLMGYNAERLVEASPADYTEMAKSVRELQATRGEMQGRLEQAVSHLPPGEQQKALADFDQVVNTLASNLPKGLSTEKALSEQEKRYMVFARSVLDQVYGTQVVSNGGQYAEEAARAFQSVPGGKEYLDKFAEGLRTRINENEKLRGNEQLMQVYRNVKRASGVKGLSGGRKGAIMFSSSAMFGQGGGEGGGGGLGAAPKVGASARQQAGQSLAGVFKTQ